MSTNSTIGFDFYSANGRAWKLVTQHKPDFVIIGATQGMKTEYERYGGRTFKSDWEKAKTLNLLRSAYHVYLEEVDPLAQAAKFLEVVHDAGGENELPLALDVELVGGHAPPQAAGVHACLQFIENQTHRKPIIYTSAHMWAHSVGAAGWASDYDLWVAGYPGGQTSDYHAPPITYKPRIPNDWATKGKTWKFWQYVDIGVDLNVFGGTPAELAAYAAAR